MRSGKRLNKEGGGEGRGGEIVEVVIWEIFGQSFCFWYETEKTSVLQMRSACMRHLNVYTEMPGRGRTRMFVCARANACVTAHVC